MIEDPHVDLGHLMIAIAEPHRDGLEEYHRWFEREHMYQAVLIGPGAFAAERYVATRELKALRFPRDPEEPRAGATDGTSPRAVPSERVFRRVELGSFVALYYLARGTDDEHFAWSYAQTARLSEAGRTNRDRELVLTWLCDHRGRVARDPDSVPEEIALDHRYEGLAMLWLGADDDGSDRPAGIAQSGIGIGRDREAVERLAGWLEKQGLPDLLADSPIDQALVFEPRDFPAPPADVPITPGSIAPNPWKGRGLLVVCFLDAPPQGCWSEHFVPFARRLAEAGHGEVRLAAPFVPVDRGTRRYLDALG